MAVEDRPSTGEQRARDADVALRRTLQLIEEANREAETFRHYMEDNHWADKARALFARRDM